MECLKWDDFDTSKQGAFSGALTSKMCSSCWQGMRSGDASASFLGSQSSDQLQRLGLVTKNAAIARGF